MSRKISEKDIKLLYSLSAGRCNICGKSLFQPKSNIGFVNISQMAHIYPYANNESSPRYINGKTGDNSYYNLILLCANDHLMVDNYPEFYTTEKLHQIKNDFEKYIKLQLTKQSSKDRSLIDLIKENFNLQNLLHSLDYPLNYLPLDIGNIADIENFILIPNYPTLYPFDDDKLNNKFNNMLEHYNSLYPYIMEYYFLDNNSRLAPIKDKPIKNTEKKEIVEIIERLKSSILDWLQYCRQNYS